jgi:hypothetical protein
MGREQEEEMIMSESKAQNTRLWSALLETELAFTAARMDFLARSIDRMEVIREALHDPAQRGTGLRVLPYLKVEERQELFKDLVELASVGHSDIALCREAILSLPREWVVANIERFAEPLLQAGDYEEYRRLLELYNELDSDLTSRLATRAAQSEDADIREAGEDFRPT